MAAHWKAGWILAMAGLLPAVAMAGTSLPDGPHIVVNGAASVSVKPDTVKLDFDFTAKSAQPLTAKRIVDDNVNRVLAELAKFGIADDDIKASSLTLSEDVQYSNGGRRVSNGHEAERTITVKLHQVDRLNDLIDAGLAAGAQEVSSVNFESSRSEQIRADAKRQAAENARGKAEQGARAFGATLGAVYSIDSIRTTQFDGYAGTLNSVVVTGSNSPSGRYLQPTIDYSESVQAVFELKR